jgi:DNA-binding transcriptional ArsR family regulator
MKFRSHARAQVSGKRAAPKIAPKPMSPAELDFDMLLANARQASELLKALSHEVRLLILCFLIEGEKSVGEIEKLLDLRQPAVSQQLARLRADGLVETRRNGKSIYYSLARSEVRDVIGVLHDAFCKPRKTR